MRRYKKQPAPPRPPRALFEEVEPRLLFSADTPLFLPPETSAAPTDAASMPVGAGQVLQASVSASPTAEAAPRELVIIDAGVENTDALVADLQRQQQAGRSVEVVVLEAGRDGVLQITEALSSQRDLTAIHILSHGDSSGLQLGSGRLDQAALLQQAELVSTWSAALADSADLMLYGCDLAAGAQGRELIDQLALLTGADVAASDDLTGAAALGGDWTLEFQHGQIESLALFSPWQVPDWQGVLATYTVTSTVDNASAASTAGTLRWAITQANANAGTDTIAFNITGTAGTYGEYTITPYTAMPTITGAVILDGSTQPGYGAAGHPLIVLDGNGGSAYGLHLSNTSDGSTIRGLVIRDYTSYGIYIPADSNSHTIVGNYIGSFNADGSDAGVGKRNDAAGIYSHGTSVTIGGTTAAERNVISGNGPTYNIYLGTGSDNDVVQGNYLGTNAAGTSVFANNGSYGIMVESSSTNVTIGGATAGARNVISGFSTRNIWLTTTGTSTVQGNYIGTNAAGTAALGGGWGIYKDDTGSATVSGNVISGNASGGIYIADGFLTITGNVIGLNAAGTAALGNTGVGIEVSTNDDVVIGGTTAAARNVISGNTSHGISVTTTATGTHLIIGNYIGLGSDGTTLLGNGGAGVYIAASNVQVGGKSAGQGNIIAGNTGAGIAVASGNTNLFYRNSIYSNGGLGIDLGNDGVTANDLGDGDGGGNYSNNFPVITTAFNNGTVTKVTGSLEWYAQAQPVTIDFFSSPTVDASGYGEGRTYLGSVTLTTSSTGDVQFSVDLPTVAAGQYITAVANIEAGPAGASEFSAAVMVIAAATGNRGKVIWNVNDQLYSWYASWNGTSFTSPAVTGVGVTDDITMMLAAEAPTRDEVLMIGSADASGKILALIWNGSSWSAPLTLPLATPAAAASQYNSFAVAYESTSGDALLVWDNGNTGTTGLSYAVWNGTTWSAINTITAPVSGEPYQMKLAASPTSDEMVLVAETSAGSSNQFAIVWNGSSWGNAQTLGSDSSKQYFEVNVAYESVSGRALVFYDNSASNQPTVQYRVWNGSAWSAESSIAVPAGVGSTLELYSTAVASDPTSNRIALLAQTSSNYLWAAVWDGSAWGGQKTLTTSAPLLTDSPMTANVAFESKSGDLLAVYSKNTGPNVYYQTWTSGGGWSAEQTGPSMGGTDTPLMLRLYSDPYSNTVMLGAQDGGQDLNFVAWNGSSWGTVTQLDAATGETYRQNFTYVWNEFNKTVLNNVAGDTLAYLKGDGARVIDQGYAATVTDSDIVGFSGGTLTVSLTAGSTAAQDVLGIQNQGTGTGQIGVSGSNVTYEGVVIGTWTGGSSGTALVITLNANATAAAVGALASNITYQNTNTSSPSTSTRTVRFALVDALGTAATARDASITVTNPSPGSVSTTFQEGVGGYTGTQDTYVDKANSSTSYGASTILKVDDGSPNDMQTLIRFDNLFGNGAGQIPYGSTITSASLTVYVTNADSGDVVTIHRVLINWSESSTYASLVNGVSTDGSEASSTVLYTLDAGISGSATLTGLASAVQAWANGESNYGFLIATGTASADDWTIASSEGATASQRPVLNVTYTPPAAPVVDLDANNSTGATGPDSAKTFVENGGPVLIADSDATITDADSTQLTGMTVTLTNRLNGTSEVLAATTTGTSISASYNSGTGVLTLSGTDTVANYQKVLRTITYNNTSDAPSTTTRYITVVATDGYVSSATATAEIAVTAANDSPTGSVSISGTATQGQTLTASNSLADADGLGTITYTWLRNGVSTGSTGSTYVLSQSDVGATISVRASYTDAYGTAEAVTSGSTAAVANLNDSPTGSVSISGTATQGQTLTASNTLADVDGLGTITYTWLRNGVSTGSTGSTYVLSQSDVGAAISVRASYTDQQGTAETATSSATAAVANVNDSPTGSVSISGTATQGQTLTASNTLADVDGLGTITYTWLRNGVSTGSTGSTYVLSQADVGATMSVRASYTDQQGAAETATSSATAAVANVNDSPTGSVSISGTATQGQTLTASNTLADVDGLGTITYTWLRNGVSTGSTGSTYVLSQSDVGAAISVRASYTDQQGTAETATSSATAVVANVNDSPTGSVSISGTATQGQTLTASNTLADVDGLGTITYTWLRNGVSTGSTGSTYVLSQADVGATMSVRASYTDQQGTAETATSSATSAVANVNDSPTGSVSISGTATQGQTLTASNTLADVDGLGAITYTWLRNGVSTGSTGSTYVLSQSDVGATISVRASYTDQQGTAETATSSATAAVANVNDAPTGSVSISGTATQGQTLTASNTLADVDGLGTITYTWLRNGVSTGSTGSTYVLSQSDVGAAISVRASYTDQQGTAETATSSATAAVANINDSPTGSVSISGTATQGQTLTASNTLADVDGLGTITYTWLRNGVSTGSTGSTYVLSQADVGATMSVRASYTDQQGTAETATSSATSAVANVNDSPTGSVSISGTATQGQMLTASNTLADVDGLGTITYTWLRNGVSTGSTGSTYVLSQSDVGATISVRASYTDQQGTAETATSSATAAVANVNDAPTGSVSISGTATQGQTLTASNTLADVDGLGTITYTWLRNGVSTGSTGSTYVLSQSDVGAAISVRASYTDQQGTAETATSSATAAVANVNDSPTGSVSISGTATQGQTLTASNTLADVDGLGTITYAWLRNGVSTGSTGSTYVLSQADVGSAISVRASYTDQQGTAETATSSATAAVANVNDSPTGSVSISGTATQGQTLTASNTLADVDGLGTITYTWLRNGVSTGSTGSTYVLSQSDVGAAISARASYTDQQGTAEAVTSSATDAVANVNDAPTGSVTISGTATQGQTLTASNTLADVDGLGTITYTWLRNGVSTGSTGSTYVLSQADVGATMSVRASYTDQQGTAETATSSATAAVANVNDSPTGSVSISGTATQGQTLTASNTLADVDGLGTITYTWLRNGVSTGSTGSTYVLSQADVGSAISVRASYTDQQGTAETATSSATAAVANVNDSPTGAVSISGTATQGQTLTASNTLADADGLGTITYTWLRNGVSTGSTGSTYVLSQADVGATMSVRASYTDQQGTAEAVTSSTTAAVANVNDSPTGSVSISGTATQGQTLTASNTLADVDGLGTITYTWLRNGVSTGSTGSTYVLSQADVGATMSVRASYTDQQGTAETATSSATAAVANVNDSPIGSVSISGTATQGQTLTASNTLADADGLGTITYTWLRNGVSTGSTGSTYVLSQSDVGAAISVRASYTDQQGTAETATSSATAAVANVNDAPTGSVSISGTATQGQTLTASNTLADVDGLGTITYTWLRNGVSTGSTGSTYVLSQSDVGAAISVRASYTDQQGTAEAVTSSTTAAVANVNDAPTGSVTVSGTVSRGETLTASHSLADADGLGAITYTWLRDGVDTGVTGSTYLLDAVDVGAVMSVRASYTDLQGTPESVDSAATAPVTNVNTAPTGSVSISGTPTQGQTLTASDTLGDADGLGTITYTWLRNGVSTGATGSTYVLSQADVGATMSVRASYTDQQGTAETVTSGATAAVANVNDAPTGAVSISGTATQGQTLTAGNTLADADGLGPITYTWLRNGASTGATGSTYVLTQADVGATMSVRADYTDQQGAAETVTSSATAAVANVNDAPTGSVSISGTATQGQTLTASNTLADTDGLGTITYTWLRNGVSTGSTGSTYVLSQADVGATMSVQASYTDQQGTAETAISSATAAVANVNDAPTGSVSISGTATQGQTLTASNILADTDGLGTVTYTWLRNGVSTGSTGSSYVLSQADVGAAMSVQASYTDQQGTAETVVSSATAAVANVNDAPTGSVSISGTATQGQTLTASSTLADADGLGTITYTWLRNGVSTGSSGSTYVLSQADVGATITVQASYTDALGTAEAVTSAATAAVANVNDAPTGSVSISGTAAQGQTLTAGNTLADADGLGTITYTWLRNGVSTGSTGSTYVLGQADVGAAISVQASYTDALGTAEAVTSAATAAVANVNDAPTGSVSISGTTTQGQTLTASNTLADADGLGTITYTWLRNGVNTGSTGSTYVLGQADVSAIISVQASYTDALGTAEAVTSAATATVANVNDSPTGSVSISGTAAQGQTLTASNTLADADGLGTITYTWLRNGVSTGSTGSTYVLGQADVGAAISVQASYTDALGTAEAVASGATAAIANVNDTPTGAVSISGTAAQGQTLTASNTLADVDGLGTITYTWLRNGVSTGATGSTYVLSQSDVGANISVQASYTDALGTAESVTSSAAAAVANVNDAPTGSVSISGAATQGQTLAASDTLADADGLGTITYTWMRNGVSTGSTGGTYVLGQADVGAIISVQASYTDALGTAEAVTSAATATVANVNDAPTGSVSISGTAAQGQTLTASNTLADADGLGTITYTWLRNGVSTGSTGSTYVLSQADVGATMSVRASYTDALGTAEAVASSATAAVANVNDAPTGAVSISGTATQGQTLTASNTLADADGLGTITYTWLRNGVSTGATGSTYVLGQADVGAAIAVQASYTDALGTAEAVSSSATGAVANVNDSPAGTVSVTGTALQGQTLTASSALSDADGLGPITYHWLRNGVDTGATGATYLLGEGDVGAAITARATYTDAQGTAEAVVSTPTAIVANLNDNPTGAVAITGTPTQGQSLTASHTLADADGLGAITYTWLRNGVSTGATGSTYVLTQADVGATIAVQASYTDGHGTGEAVASSPTAAVANINDAPTGAVTLTGTAVQGQVLTAGDTLADADALGAVAYHWWRNGADTGHVGSSYTLTQADVGASLTVRAVYTDGQGTVESVDSMASATVANVNDGPAGSVAITGTAQQGQTLTASHTLTDADGLGTVTYQWLRNGVATGATGGSYVLAQADVGAAMSVRAVYTDAFGTPEAVASSPTAAVLNVNDLPAGSVVITGTLLQGQTLSVSDTLADADGLGAVTHRWLRNGVDTGVSGSTYVLTQDDVGAVLTVRATYTDQQGTAERVDSAATGPVANANDAPTGGVAVSGTAVQGQTLTASHTLADADGLGTVTYTWLRNGVSTGATGGTYVLTQADVGAAMSVRASYTDGFGNLESVDSLSTGAVANVNDAPTGAVSISGSPAQGQTLSVVSTLADADGLGTVTYHWLRDGIDTGATGGTYVLTQADVGSAMTVRAVYTDQQGTAESVDSAAAGPVSNVNDAPAGTVTISGNATQGQTLTVSDTLTDADGMGTVTYHWLRNGNDTGATGGSYVLTQDDVDAVITVRATYTDATGVAESADSAGTGLVVDVNDVPTLGLNTGWTVSEGGSVILGNAQLRAADIDQDPSTLRYVVTVPSAHGWIEDASGTRLTVFTQAQLDSQSLRFVHDGSELPADSLTLRVEDGRGGSSASATVVISVSPINDAPTLAGPTQLSGLQSTPLPLQGAGWSLTDPDSLGATFTAVLQVSHGLLTAQAGSLALTITGSGTATVTLQGSPAQIAAWLQGQSGTLLYAGSGPSSDTLMVSVNDGAPGAGGPGWGTHQTTLAQTAPPVVIVPPAPATPSVPEAPAPTTPPSPPASPEPAAEPPAEEPADTGSVALPGPAAGEPAADGNSEGALLVVGPQPAGDADGAGRPVARTVQLSASLQGAPQPAKAAMLTLLVEPGGVNAANGTALLAPTTLTLASDDTANPVQHDAGQQEEAGKGGWLKMSADEQLKTTGTALSLGAVWWISRGAGLLSSLLVSTPIWRQIDPLPIFGGGPNDDPESPDDGDDGNPDHASEADAERLFARVARKSAALIE